MELSMIVNRLAYEERRHLRRAANDVAAMVAPTVKDAVEIAEATRAEC